MKAITTLILLLLAMPSLMGKAPPLKERVNEFCAKYPTPEKIAKRLEEWSQAEPQNAEPYILAANAYAKAAAGVSVTSDTKGNGFMIVDPKTKKQVGSIRDTLDPKVLRKAFDTLTTAAQKFPSRLDIMVGRLTMADRLNDISAIVQSGEDMLNRVATHPEGVLWTDGEPLKTPVNQKVASEIHPRIANLYGRGTDESDLAASRLAVAALKLAPTDVRLINDAALYHAHHQQWDKALDYFMKAQKVEPDDLLIQHNIALANLKLGHVAEARKLWRAILAKAPKGSEDAEAAESSLKSLPKEER